MKTAICDDNETVVQSVRNALLKLMDDYPLISIEEFFSGESLLKAYKQGNTYDILFLDIQMDKLNGIQTARIIKELQENVLIIFLTGYTNYVKEAFRLQAFQYLTKPVKQDEVIKEFNRAIEQYKKNHYKYRLIYNNCISYLEIHNIQYLEVSNHIITVYVDNNKYIIKGRLQDEENKLKKFDFIRCHQGYLVNIAWIQLIDTQGIILKTGTRIPISRRMRKNVLDKFSAYIIGKSI